MLSETDGTGATQVVYSYYPSGFGNLLHQWQPPIRQSIFDAMGNVVKLGTNSTVAVISDTYAYDAWGNIVDTTGTTKPPFRYIGRLGYYYDEDTGLYWLRARYYNAETGRFKSEDPLRDDAGMNLYGYVDGMPTVSVDPSGLQILGGVVVGVIGVGVPTATCAFICEQARRAGLDGGDAAGVVCKNGKKCPCVWRIPRGPISIVNKVVKCALEHEKKHFEHVKCKGCSLHRPLFPWLWRKLARIEIAYAECQAFAVEIRCLLRERRTCTNNWCRRAIMNRIQDAANECARYGLDVWRFVGIGTRVPPPAPPPRPEIPFEVTIR